MKLAILLHHFKNNEHIFQLYLFTVQYIQIMYESLKFLCSRTLAEFIGGCDKCDEDDGYPQHHERELRG